MNNLFKQMDKDWNVMLDAMRATGAIIKEGEMAIEPEVFGLNARESYLANKEAAKQAFLLQREIDEINEDNRRLDHDSY